MLVRLPIYLFAISFASISYTSLRFTGSIGVGELCILATLSILLISLRGQFQVVALSDSLSVFWLAFLILLLLGYLSAVIMQLDEIGQSFHDFLAFLFCFISYLVFRNLVLNYGIRDILLSCVGIGLISVLILLAYGLLDKGGAFMILARFHGLSKNPNQLALFSLFLMYFSLALYHLDSSKRRLSCLSFLFSLVIGILTKSDAFLLAVVAFIGGSLVMYILQYAFSSGIHLRKIFAWAFLIVCLSMVLASLDILSSSLDRMSNEGGQGSIRFTLWQNGLEAMFTAPVLGVGPGAWSGLLYPLQGHEAHNTFIDFGNSFGVIGISGYILLLCYASYHFLIIKKYDLFCLFWSISFFSVFHYILRFPFIWVAMALPFLLRSEYRKQPSK